MSRKWLLFSFCLSVLLTLAPLSRANLTLSVNESATRVLFREQRIEVSLAIENSTGEAPHQKIQLELLDPTNHACASVERIESIGQGKQTLGFSLPFDVAKLSERSRQQLLWYRLHYRIASAQAPAGATDEGIVSLSEITPDLFEVRVAAAQMAHEGMRYRARVQAIHPITEKPASKVRVDAVLTLETDDDGNGVKLPAAGVTDASGYAILNFDLPARFPQFPHALRPAGGSIKVRAERSGLIAEAENEVLVDQFPRILISTDKPLYQPGQPLHLRALVLSPTKHALANQDVLFRIDDPENTNVFRETVKSSRFGIASVDWSIPENIRLGDYWIKVALGVGEDSSQTSVKVRISRYDLPNFSVQVHPDRTYYLPGQNAEVKISADYLFGQPVTHGHVRVVREAEREWNYKDQKWDIEEGDKYEGETDAGGVFVAHVKLAEDQENLADNDYRRFRDLTYAAYFTDPTNNRTEQRRFDLRITRDPIHVYVIRSDDVFRHGLKLPLRFYVSTFYADGAPAQCRLNVSLKNEEPKNAKERQPTSPLIATFRTNRYGLAKVNGLRLSNDLDDDVELKVAASDARGKTGSAKEEIALDDDQKEMRVETDKSLYRPGEPIVVSIKSSVSNVSAVIDVAREAVVLDSQTVRLRDGGASITIPFKPEFKDRLTIAAYADFTDSPSMIGTRTILFPRNQDLRVDVQPAATNYRPGEEAQVTLRVRGPQGEAAASALGLVIVDKAVDERFRTDGEFTNRAAYGFYGSIRDVLGSDEEVAGVTLRDLQHLDLTKPFPPEMELVAEVLLNQNRNYYPVFFGGDSYDRDQQKVFGDPIKIQLGRASDALSAHYANTGDYPESAASVRSLLSAAGVDFDRLRDPWGNSYRALFSIDQKSDVLSFTSAGADKQFDTDDDFSIEINRWPYFRPFGEAIDRAVRQFHARTGGFIRDRATLGSEVAKEGLDLDALRDRWNQPYRLSFDVDHTSFAVTVSSGGPDQKFRSAQSYSGDDFVIWVSSIDYFAEPRAQIDSILTQELKSKNRFPQNEQDLRALLRDSEQPFESLRDPWQRPYYATFKIQPFYTDQIQIQNRAGQPPVQRAQVTPVTATARVIKLRSMGADGKIGTPDDFDVATFAGSLTEQGAEDTTPRLLSSQEIFSDNSGAITGVIIDPQGALVAGASITATASPGTASYSTWTDDEGRFGFAKLPPGMYTLRIEARGFKLAIVTEVLVRASNIADIKVALELGAASETVTVVGGAVEMQTKSSSLDFLVSLSGRQVSHLRNINVVTRSGGSEQSSTPRLREYFPETLVWQPALETDKQGRAQLKFKLADNITTWKMSVIGSTEDGQIGTVEKEIKAFQPFFVEHDPPRILTEGDEISLPVVVRNYLDRAQTVNLEIKPESWFALLGPATKSVNVAAGDATRGTFDFRASASVKDGKQRITATSAEANDAIEKPVTVHPDGEEKSVTASDVITESAALTLDLPQSAVPNSPRAELKIYPNLMAHVAESVEAIMSRPYGCGEQTISSTYPSLLYLRHYERVGPPVTAGGSDSRAKAERYLRAGYSRLLNYRDESGGFTYWGSGDPDTALTAYALRFLSEARQLIAIDDDAIKDARAWLVKQQRADGSWAAFDYNDKVENKRRTALLTAYVARVLALTAASAKIDGTSTASQQAVKEVSPELKRALDYLAARSEEINEPYLIASYALSVLAVSDTKRAAPVIEKLRTLTHEESGASYWSLETNTPFYGWGLAGRVETTALVVQALAKESQADNSHDNDQLISRGLLFLLREKDRYGVWYSTQATINVLDALLVLLGRDADAARTPKPPPTAEIIVNGRNVKSVELPAPNRLVGPLTIDLSQVLQAGTNRVEIKRARGSSPASVQAVATYYLPWPESGAIQDANWRANGSSGLRLVTKFDKTESNISDPITCHVEAQRIGFSGYGMLLAEIGLPPGADVDRASLDLAMKGADWSISQYDILPDRLVVYLWPRAGGTNFDFKFRPRIGLNAQTAASTVYDYYNPDARAIVAPTRFVVK